MSRELLFSRHSVGDSYIYRNCLSVHKESLIQQVTRLGALQLHWLRPLVLTIRPICHRKLQFCWCWYKKWHQMFVPTHLVSLKAFLSCCLISAACCTSLFQRSRTDIRRWPSSHMSAREPRYFRYVPVRLTRLIGSRWASTSSCNTCTPDEHHELKTPNSFLYLHQILTNFQIILPLAQSLDTCKVLWDILWSLYCNFSTKCARSQGNNCCYFGE